MFSYISLLNVQCFILIILLLLLYFGHILIHKICILRLRFTLRPIGLVRKSEKALMVIPKNDYLACFEDGKKLCHKCILSRGDYFKGD